MTNPQKSGSEIRYRWLDLVAYAVLFAVVLTVLVLAIAHPDNHLIPWQMLLGTIVGTTVVVGAGILWSRFYDRLGRKTVAYVLCLAVYGIILYLISMNRQDNVYTLADYAQVYTAAESMANEGTIGNASYFRNYANNINPMLLLSLLFRIANTLHISQYHFVLGIQVLQMLSVIWACGYLCEREGDTRWRFPMFLAFVCLLPVWGLASVFYTDSMSFGLGILALAFLKKAAQQTKKSRIFWIVSAAVSIVLGCNWKITSAIPVIAAVLVILWQRIRCRKKDSMLFLLCLLLFGLAMHAWTNSYEVTGQSKATANPLISWVALGMKEDGSWNNNKEFVYSLLERETTAEKKAYSLEYIRQNQSSFWEKQHLVRKICRNFANGNLGANEFLPAEDDDSVLLWAMFSPWGKYYWRTSQYCFCYLSTMYALLLLGIAACFVNLCKGKKIPPLLMICQLGFFGIFLFLMLWEANSRQLYNQMPGILLGAILSLQYFMEFVTEKRHQK